MKQINTLLTILFISITLLNNHKSTAQENSISPKSNFELIVQHLESNGNFINSESTPALISASEVKKNTNNNKYLILDIRNKSWFEYGHIKNAHNIKSAELLDYFKKDINPEKYQKIVLACYSGQSAAYYVSLLRLYGYNNVYSLKWGMSSWAEDFASKWTKNASDKYVKSLENTANQMPQKGAFPKIESEQSLANEILKERIAKAIKKPYKEFIVKSEVVFESPKDYYIINYVSEDIYSYGHIKGAVRYQPQSSLNLENALTTIPTNKKVIVNCLTGQTAAYIVAYLHVLGYDVANLAYGSNSYMNTTLLEKKWKGFSKKEIKNYPISE